MMTEFLDINGRRIAYEMAGEGPLVVLSPGMGDLRQAYRFLAPRLVQAGYRVACADLRGHGESSTDWPSVTGKAAITRTDVAGDLLALVAHLGGPAVIAGHSLSGGAATIAAASKPGLVSGIVEIAPFTRTQKDSVGGVVRIRRYRRGMIRLQGTQLLRSLGIWLRYLDVAYPAKPADYTQYIAALRAKLAEPGRMAEFMKTGRSTPADAQAQLPGIRCPALIIMGTLDPDFADPAAEGEAIAAAMPPGLATVAMVEGAGHYPHAQCPGQVAALMTGFLESTAACRPESGISSSTGSKEHPHG